MNQVIEIGTKESDSSVGFIWIVSLIISFIYAFKNKNSNLLLNKISHQKKELKILLYILYIILVIPVFIDIVIIITNIVKKYQLKQ